MIGSSSAIGLKRTDAQDLYATTDEGVLREEFLLDGVFVDDVRMARFLE